MSAFSAFKQQLGRRNSYYLATIVASAFALELIVDKGVNSFWEWNNKGVIFSEILFIIRNYGKTSSIDTCRLKNNKTIMFWLLKSCCSIIKSTLLVYIPASTLTTV